MNKYAIWAYTHGPVTRSGSLLVGISDIETFIWDKVWVKPQCSLEKVTKSHQTHPKGVPRIKYRS